MLLSLASASIYARKTSHPEPTLAASVKAIVTSSWFNLLVVFIPVSWALHYAKPDEDVMIFVFSFLALVPLAQLLGFATEEISMRVGQTLAGLLNATMGNVPELLVAAIALSKCQLRIVQSSLIGSILSNLLLVLGMCFFAGGTHFSEQGFSIGAAQINSSLLMLSSVAVLLPALLYFAVTTGSASAASATDAGNDILKISHGAALLLLIIYLCYLYFQLRSHAYVYADVNNPEVPASLKYGERRKPAPAMNDSEAAHSDNNEDEKPSVSLVVCIGLMVIVTVLIAFTSEALVDSIDGTASKAHINKEFIGLILLPICSNACEHWSALTVSVKDKLTLSIGIAVGSSIQIALFVIPFIVTLGWILGHPLSLYFDPFESAALFLSVVTVNYVIADGKSNWLEGAILMVLYLIIAICVFFYSGTAAILSC